MTLADTIASWLSLASLMICATLAIPSHQDSSRSRKVPLDPSKDSAIASHGFGVMNATSSQPVYARHGF
jgi:hypothetical protein